MSIILDTRTQSTMKGVQYNGRQDPGGYKRDSENRYKLGKHMYFIGVSNYLT